MAALQGESADLPALGLAGTMYRVGFQPHDARIFEALLSLLKIEDVGAILGAVEEGGGRRVAACASCLKRIRR